MGRMFLLLFFCMDVWVKLADKGL